MIYGGLTIGWQLVFCLQDISFLLFLVLFFSFSLSLSFSLFIFSFPFSFSFLILVFLLFFSSLLFYLSAASYVDFVAEVLADCKDRDIHGDRYRVVVIIIMSEGREG